MKKIATSARTFTRIDGTDVPGLTAGGEDSSTALTGWDTAFRPGDEFKVVLLSASGDAVRAEVAIFFTVDHAAVNGA